jgi:hypothetical protein
MAIHGTIHNPMLRAILRAEGLKQVAFAPLAEDLAWFKASTAPTAGDNKTTTLLAASMTAAGCPGWPVVPVITVIDSSGSDVTGVSAVVQGIDQLGDNRTESITATDSSGTWTGTALHAYETLISVAITIAGTADAGDRYTIGFSKTYGFGCRIAATSDVVSKMFNGAADAGTVSIPYNTYVVAGTPDAAKELMLVIRPSYYFGPA